MTLREMIYRQMYLNSLLPTKPTVGQLALATAAEVGELVQALKYGVKDPAIEGWCWWPRPDKPGKPSTKEEVLGELVDIWHFVLSLLAFSLKVSEEFANRVFRLSETLYQGLWNDKRTNFSIAEISSNNYFQSVIGVARCLGFTKEEFEAAYWAKTEENIKRWEVCEPMNRKQTAPMIDKIYGEFCEYIKHLPCFACGKYGVHVAHISAFPMDKATQYMKRRQGIAILACIPLCPKCHLDGIHSTNEDEYFESIGKTRAYAHGYLAKIMAEFFLQRSGYDHH